MAQIEITPVPHLDLGEGPHWDEYTKSLYFVDLFMGTINKYIPATKTHIWKKISNEPVTFIVPVANKPNEFIIGEDLTLKLIEWDTEANEIKRTEILATIPESSATNRTNDGKCDIMGRLWFGTMAKNEFLNSHPSNGSFYSYTRKEGLRKIISDVGISNGLAWNKCSTKLFYIDSFKYTVDEMDFLLLTGEAKNRRTLFSYKENSLNGLPDGMTIDTQENLWFANHNNKEIIKIDSTNGKILRTIAVGAEQVTSVAFGGPDLNDLYVTTGGHGTDEEKSKLNKESGALYKISGLNAKGYPSVPFNDSI